MIITFIITTIFSYFTIYVLSSFSLFLIYSYLSHIFSRGGGEETGLQPAVPILLQTKTQTIYHVTHSPSETPRVYLPATHSHRTRSPHHTAIATLLSKPYLYILTPPLFPETQLLLPERKKTALFTSTLYNTFPRAILFLHLPQYIIFPPKVSPMGPKPY